MQNPEKFEHSTKMMEDLLMPFRQLLTMQKGSNMNQISRTEAIKQLCFKKLTALSAERRESHILDWWGIDEDDAEFSLLSADLQSQMLNSDEPPSDSENSNYDELILIALQAELKGVTNIFLSENLVTMGLGDNEVCGELEQLEICPCCEYQTLESRGEYNICGLCGWEDNDVNEVAQYSGPNHMTLGEAKSKFIEDAGNLPLDKWVKA